MPASKLALASSGMDKPNMSVQLVNLAPYAAWENIKGSLFLSNSVRTILQGPEYLAYSSIVPQFIPPKATAPPKILPLPPSNKHPLLPKWPNSCVEIARRFARNPDRLIDAPFSARKPRR